MDVIGLKGILFVYRLDQLVDLEWNKVMYAQNIVTQGMLQEPHVSMLHTSQP